MIARLANVFYLRRTAISRKARNHLMFMLDFGNLADCARAGKCSAEVRCKVRTYTDRLGEKEELVNYVSCPGSPTSHNSIPKPGWLCQNREDVSHSRRQRCHMFFALYTPASCTEGKRLFPTRVRRSCSWSKRDLNKPKRDQLQCRNSFASHFGIIANLALNLTTRVDHKASTDDPKK